jgi:5-hydroxyisourate hydrolase
MTGLTTHVLDTTLGLGAAGMKVRLRRVGTGQAALAEATLDAKGRAVLADQLSVGVYELLFEVADYHRARGLDLPEPPFLDQVTVRFGVSDPQMHHHVPLLISPYGYSTYRGS